MLLPMLILQREKMSIKCMIMIQKKLKIKKLKT